MNARCLVGGVVRHTVGVEYAKMQQRAGNGQWVVGPGLDTDYTASSMLIFPLALTTYSEVMN